MRSAGRHTPATSETHVSGKGSRLKILLISTLYTPNLIGGMERAVQLLAENLAREGHQVVVASTAPERGVRTATVNGVKGYYVGLKNLYWPFGEKENYRALKPLVHALDTYNPWMVREVARILDEERPDLVHTNGLGGFSVLAWKLVEQRRLPLVHTLHDHYLLCPRTTMFRKGRSCDKQCAECRLYSLPRRRLSQRVDAVVGVSRYILERHLELGYFAATPERRVIPNAYQVRPTNLSVKRRSPLVRFGYLGMLHPVKGIEGLLEAVVQLQGSWSLSVAGRGRTAYERDLHTRYKRPGVKFMGHVDPESFFPEIDVLVLPSLVRESFGRVIIESYAHGVPVIGTTRGGILELVEEGRTGFLFDPDRAGDLAARMQRYIDNPTMINDMRPVCLEKANDFLPENITEQYLETYRRALANT
jgi:glycosyltransferase involved in cell wall biosynthesis